MNQYAVMGASPPVSILHRNTILIRSIYYDLTLIWVDKIILLSAGFPKRTQERKKLAFYSIY